MSILDGRKSYLGITLKNGQEIAAPLDMEIDCLEDNRFFDAFYKYHHLKLSGEEMIVDDAILSWSDNGTDVHIVIEDISTIIAIKGSDQLGAAA